MQKLTWLITYSDREFTISARTELNMMEQLAEMSAGDMEQPEIELIGCGSHLMYTDR
ncbi:MAG: hypothetical protein GWN00_01455 [Aliifodinibius sp.]|nr:hypothetical protein [Phycisphaerae bacterium]NIR62345.1 hypothetical protein [candidate division Zixibacteria bacterium]NIT54945.1 hypothetical protein [Fodinibius sp.]NIW43357.1 hypothetical protein [Gammaproteobacteria bacterium]NIU12579.1 hypothetical protein [candidate division Zixibacteria bacterium]